MTNLPNSFIARPIAHRGLHDAKNGRAENSPTALNAAISAGYGIEIDVQLSSDATAIVFHDYHLGRLTSETGALARHSARALSEIILTGGQDTIPSLKQTLALVAGRVPLLIEIKDQDGNMGCNVGPLEEAVAAALESYDGDVAVMSFNPNAVAAFATLSPEIPVGLATDRFEATDWPSLSPSTREQLRNISDFDWVGACFISHNKAQLDDQIITSLKAQGVPILCWVVQSQADEVKARTIADNITFDGYLA
jgi:glycerophosphoryl diester phosphodiesterase